MNNLQPLSFAEYRLEARDENARHQRKLNKLEERLKLFQNNCKHEKTIYQGDPAGGSDSCYICTACDKEL